LLYLRDSTTTTTPEMQVDSECTTTTMTNSTSHVRGAVGSERIVGIIGEEGDGDGGRKVLPARANRGSRLTMLIRQSAAADIDPFHDDDLHALWEESDHDDDFSDDEGLIHCIALRFAGSL
jgi:hypothetical protein